MRDVVRLNGAKAVSARFVPNALTILSGNDQTDCHCRGTIIASAFFAPLKVAVTMADGAPVAGAAVTFTSVSEFPDMAVDLHLASTTRTLTVASNSNGIATLAEYHEGRMDKWFSARVYYRNGLVWITAAYTNPVGVKHHVTFTLTVAPKTGTAP